MVKPVRNQGFTLLELLVVLFIIALLMALLFPSLAKVRSNAKRTACLSNLHSAAVGFRMYLDAYKEYMPPAARYPSLELNDKEPLSEFLVPFLAAPETLHCPADNGQQRPGYSERYYESEGSSYEYLETLGGKRVENTYLTDKLGFRERDIHIIYDYDSFHGKKGRKGSVNYLYADGHVGDRTGD